MNGANSSQFSHQSQFLLLLIFKTFGCLCLSNSSPSVTFLGERAMDSVNTAFIEAVKTGDVDTASTLFKAGGVNLEAQDGVGTALIHAVHYKHTDLIKWLLDNKANPNVTNHFGETPLELMIRKDKREIVQDLIKKGADPNATNSQGETPLMLMAYYMSNDAETIQLLIQHGAKFGSTVENLEKVKKNFSNFTLDVIFEGMRPNGEINSKLTVLDARHLAKHAGNVLGLDNSIFITEHSQEYPFEANGLFPKPALKILQERLKEYQLKDNIQHTPELKSFKQIEQALNHTIQLMDYSKEEFSKEAAENLDARFKQGELVYLPSGWNGTDPDSEGVGHTVSIALHGKYLVYCNRGFKGDLENATKIFEIPDLEKINPDFIKKCLYAYTDGPNHLNETLNSIGIELDKPLLSFPSKGQEHGNCAIANPRAAVEAMLLLCANENKDKTHLLKLASTTDRKAYKNFSQYTRDKEIDFIIEKSHFATTPIIQEFYVNLVKGIIYEHGGLNARTEDKRKEELLRSIKLLDNLAPLIKEKCEDQFAKLLVVAQAYGHKEVADMLISRGVSVSLESDSQATRQLLLESAEKGKSEVLEVLMKHGVKPDIREKISNATALMYAAEYNHLDAVKILFRHGAVVNAQDEYGKTALHYAAEHGQLEVIKILLKKGANINVQDKEGTTPLMLAAEYGHVSVVKKLVENKAEIQIENQYHYTAEKYASEYEHVAVVNFLVDAQKEMKKKESEVLMEKHNTFLPIKAIAEDQKKAILKTKDELPSVLSDVENVKPKGSR